MNKNKLAVLRQLKHKSDVQKELHSVLLKHGHEISLSELLKVNNIGLVSASEIAFSVWQAIEQEEGWSEIDNSSKK